MLGKALEVGRDTIGVLVGRARGLAALVGARVVRPIAYGLGRGGPPPEPETPSDLAVEPAADTTGAVKYALGVTPSPPGARAEEVTGLPCASGPVAVLMVRDPWWLFAYWETTCEQVVRARETLGPAAREILRVYDVTFIAFRGDNAWLFFDVDLPAGADHRYVNVPRPAASYCLEVGLRAPDGRFLALARSNVARTPRPSPSPDTTVAWIELRPAAGSGARRPGSLAAGSETASRTDSGTRLD
jgi:hypothetical protein